MSQIIGLTPLAFTAACKCNYPSFEGLKDNINFCEQAFHSKKLSTPRSQRRTSGLQCRRENTWLKTELEKIKDELKATKDKMRKTTFSVDTIRNNDKLCKHYTRFPNFCHSFSHFIAPYRFLWVFQGNTEEMKNASLAVSTIITILALVKTALKSVDFLASSLC